MRKIFLSIFASMLLLNAAAQSNFGLTGGINLAYHKVIPSSYSSKSFTGYVAGLFYRTGISNKISFAPEINFTLLGAKNVYFITDSTLSLKEKYFKNKAGYVELPLLLQYQLGKAYITAGPALLLKLFTKTVDMDYKPAYKRTDLSANIGIGYRVSDRWHIGLRYSHGLTDINDDPNIAAARKNRHARLGLQYSLR